MEKKKKAESNSFSEQLFKESINSAVATPSDFAAGHTFDLEIIPGRCAFLSLLFPFRESQSFRYYLKPMGASLVAQW